MLNSNSAIPLARLRRYERDRLCENSAQFAPTTKRKLEQFGDCPWERGAPAPHFLRYSLRNAVFTPSGERVALSSTVGSGITLPEPKLQSTLHAVRQRCMFALAVWVGLIAGPAFCAEPALDPAASKELDELFHAGRTLFEQFAPPEIKAQFNFPSDEEWRAFKVRFQRALAGDSLEDLAALAPEVRSVLTALRTVPGYEEWSDWLVQRLDEIEGAEEASRALPSPKQPIAPSRPGKPPAPVRVEPVPHYDLWIKRVRGRALPVRAPALLPKLRAAFVAEGVPAELAWLAEAESSFNPDAKSTSGAKGLFQFMPDSAKAMGLSTYLPDERTHPEKSARAAARYLRALHGRFGNWALALAAYNAGEGRVSRTLTARRATTFTEIASALPAETRMYVPKVCALIATRAGVSPHQIAPPRK